MRCAAAAFCLFLSPALTAAPAPQPPKDPAHGINFYSIEKEIVLGRQLSAEVEREVKLVDDPILSEYVNRLAQTIARQSDVIFPVSVRIIESGDLNAFSLPGGHIYIDSAMLRLTESEAELAFVLAHELGHVAARHATRQASRDKIMQIGSFSLLVLGGWTGVAWRELSAPAMQLGEHKSSRDFEVQADLLGVDYLDRAGYDPAAAIDVFERIEAIERKQPGHLRRLYGDHPITPARIDQTQKYLNGIAGRRSEYIIDSSEYKDMRPRAVAIENRRLAGDQKAPTLLK